MIEPLRAWLLALAGAALLTALAAMIPTSESLHRVVKLIGGVALTCLLFSPLVAFDYDSYAAALQSCRLAVQTDGAAPDCGDGLQRTVIESELRAYILDKATSLDMDVTAEVEAHRGDGELWYPYKATLSGEYTQAQKDELSELIEAELAIPAQRQNWLR